MREWVHSLIWLVRLRIPFTAATASELSASRASDQDIQCDLLCLVQTSKQRVAESRDVSHGLVQQVRAKIYRLICPCLDQVENLLAHSLVPQVETGLVAQDAFERSFDKIPQRDRDGIRQSRASEAARALSAIADIWTIASVIMDLSVSLSNSRFRVMTSPIARPKVVREKRGSMAERPQQSDRTMILDFCRAAIAARALAWVPLGSFDSKSIN